MGTIPAGRSRSWSTSGWKGNIAAQLVSLTPPTCEATDSGRCFAPRG